jgi:hypothetical protein
MISNLDAVNRGNRLMKWDALSQEPCSVARTVAVIGDRWTLMILRDCFLGVRRFPHHHRRAPQGPGRRRRPEKGWISGPPDPLRIPPH